jgi:competence protein ComEA
VAAPTTLADRLGAIADALGTSPGRLLAGVGVALAVAALLAWTVLSPSTGRASASSARAADDAALPRAAPSSSASASGDAAEVVVVYAAGAVVRPGLYRLRGEPRVADVLDAAGGPGPDADLDQVNLAAPVADGERVYVPRKGERPPDVPGSSSGAGPPGASAGPVNLNAATAEQLDALPGIGPSTAQVIIEWRRQHGRFKRVDDLLNVRGIGPAKLDALRSQVRV